MADFLFLRDMNYILFDGNARSRLLPFTFTRPVAEIRIGILTIREKWERFLGQACSWLTADYLQEKFPLVSAGSNVFINASLLPGRQLVDKISSLRSGQSLHKGEELLAVCLEGEESSRFRAENILMSGNIPQGEKPWKVAEEWKEEILRIVFPEDIFRLNGEALAADFELLTQGRASSEISSSNHVAGDHLFVEEGVEIECANINTKTGPVYIGRNAVVMEGMNLRGPVAICDGAVVKMGAKIYGPTTIGPKSVVGGEIKQSVIFGFSNKSHDGYLGNSVVGEWCNFGAGTSCSNMKNNYKPVKLWSYDTSGIRDTGLPYCGLMMGDFSRTGINTMFNTGSTVGVNVNLFDSGFPPVFVPDFSWGNGKSLQPYLLEKALETAARLTAQKGVAFTEADARVMAAVFDLTAGLRGKVLPVR